MRTTSETVHAGATLLARPSGPITRRSGRRGRCITYIAYRYPFEAGRDPIRENRNSFTGMREKQKGRSVKAEEERKGGVSVWALGRVPMCGYV